MIPPQCNADFAANMERVLDVYRRPHDANFPVVCRESAERKFNQAVNHGKVIDAKRIELETAVAQMEADNQSLRDDVDTWKRRAELAKAECDRLRERYGKLVEKAMRETTDDLLRAEINGLQVEIEHLREGRQ